MATPYSRPTTPKLTVPKIPAPPKGGGIWGPATRQQALKTPKAAPTVSPYDQFTLPDPYAPGKISSLATSGYNTDTANAQKLAAMGYPTDAAVGADYAARGAQANGIQQALAAHLAGLQGVDVAQGNAGSAALGAQNASTQATAPHIAGAPTMPGLPTSAVQAVLGSQTAAAGNYDSALQAAALSTGATAEQNALNAGTVATQGNQQNIQKTLASLLSGVPSVSARESSMTTANQGVDSANIQTKLSVYQNLVNQQQAANALGSKSAIAAADNALKQWTTQQTNATKVKLGLAGNETKTTVAGINQSGANARAKTSAAAKVTAAKTAATAKVTAAKTSAAAKTKTTPAGGFKNYKVTYDVSVPGKTDAATGLPGPATTKRVVKTVPATVWNRFNSSGPQGKRKLAIIGVPEGAKIKSSTGY